MTLPRTPSFRLEGRRALVTGAGRGIGLAAAAALAQAGAHVVLAARTEQEIAALAAEIRAEGGSAEPLVLDVTDLPAVRAAIEAAMGPAVSSVDKGPEQPDSRTARPHAIVGRANQLMRWRVAFGCRNDASPRKSSRSWQNQSSAPLSKK